MSMRLFRGIIPFRTSLLILTLMARWPGVLGQAALENRADRLEWFQDLGYGLFIHWGVDSQIGSVISHSLVGASPEYASRFFEELPKSFDPERFDAHSWARLARVGGIRYVVFTTKHHSGFTMFDTKTTSFSVINTPLGRDVTTEIVEAFRSQGIAVGFYFSPDDFHFLWKQGNTISRHRPEAQPVNNPELMAHNKAQVRELLQNYGRVDVLFFDGPAHGLLQLAWGLQPAVVITRGAMRTPEIAPSSQEQLPGLTSIEPWEANFTMGTSWQYKPTNERYRSGSDWIRLLIETRAKGGNMLLNVGPSPEGVIPIEQANILREIGLWLFVNGEAIYEVRPWVITNEGDTWYTRKKDTSTVFAIITGESWAWGEKKTVTLKSVRASADTQISVLGQNDQVLEYQPEVIPATSWEPNAGGVRIRATRAQRLYNDRKWPNPVVLKITHARPPSQ